MKKSLLLAAGLIAFAASAQSTGETTEPHYLPVTSAAQIVDGGKYVIAAYNHNWGTGENADKRFIKFENNTSKFVTAANATAESVVWTAHASSAFTCNSTGHAHGIKSRIVTFSYDDQYLNYPASGLHDSYATSTTNTNIGNVFELIEVAVPSGASTNNHYFTVHYKKATTGTTFDRSLMATLTQIGNGGTTLYLQGNNTNYFLLWHVIETENDLYTLANGFLQNLKENDVVIAPGFGNYNLSGNTDVEASVKAIVEGMEGSNAAVSTDAINNFSAAINGTIQRNIAMPEPGSYLTFKAAFSGFSNTAYLFYNTDTGYNSNASHAVNTKQNIDTRYPNANTYNANNAIVYYDNDNLLSYTTGYYLGIKDSAIRWLQESDLTETGGNEGAPIYIVRKINDANILQMNSVINGSPVAVHADAAASNRWYLNHTSYTGHENDAEYAKTGISTHNYAPWEVTTVDELPVELGADGYGSFYAPVAVSFPEDVTVYAAEVTDANINFVVVNPGTVIAPGTPVILTGTPNATVNATIDYDYQAAAEPAALAETAAPAISFYGKTAVEKLAATEGVCTFKPTAGDNNTVTLAKVEAGSTLPVNTMLMSVPEDCPLISEDGTTVALKLNESNVTVGIREIGADKADTNGAIYDLQGRRLGAPVKGINIINGRKVLVK